MEKLVISGDKKILAAFILAALGLAVFAGGSLVSVAEEPPPATVGFSEMTEVDRGEGDCCVGSGFAHVRRGAGFIARNQ